MLVLDIFWKDQEIIVKILTIIELLLKIGDEHSLISTKENHLKKVAITKRLPFYLQ
jgi:hypothetical protein